MNLFFIFSLLIIIALVVFLLVHFFLNEKFGDTNLIFDAYYINLKRRPDKNSQTLIELEKSNILKNKMKRFNAIDGNDINLTEYASKELPMRKLLKRKGWIGCALSHIELWKKCVQNNVPMLIFEDDNVIKKDLFDKHLNIVFNNFPKDFDIVYLVTDNIVKYKPFNDLFVKATSHNSILSAYIVSPKGARALIENIVPFKPTLQVDWYIDRLTRKEIIHSYIYRKNIMYTIQDFNTTDIQGKVNYVKKFEKEYFS